MRAFEKQRVRDQVVDAICERIRVGAWLDYLPSERWLSGDFGVGRDQVHQAILKLREMGIVILDGRKNRIAGISNIKGEFKSVVVMTPQKLQGASRSLLFCVDQLRSRLSRKNVPVYVESSVTMKKDTADKRLDKVVGKHRHAVWILHRATPSVQQWFQSRGLAVIILGTASERVDFPYIDIDQVAAVRHSLGVMKRAGHSLERVLFLRPENKLEGIRKMEQGYRFEMDALNVEPCVMKYREDYEGLETKLSGLFSGQNNAVKGVITTSYRAAAYLGGWLAAEKGLVVGRDLSLVCLADGPALSHLYPSVAYYSVQGDAFASKLIPIVNKLLAGERVARSRRIQLVPDFIEGVSVCKK